jgi:hypothetical protein
MSSLTIATPAGADIEIQQHELATITDEKLHNLLGMSRADLHRCFTEGMELMRGVEPGRRVRPIAEQTLDGTWFVHLVGYLPHTDPLMGGPAKGT